MQKKEVLKVLYEKGELVMNNKGSLKPSSKIILVIFLMAFVIMGIVITVIISSIFNEVKKETTIDKSQYDINVEAVIIENKVGSMSDDEGFTYDTYLPVYQYEYNGNTYTSSGGVSSTTARYSVGDKVNVMISSKDPSMLYDPDYNTESEFKSFQGDALKMFLMSGVVGIVFVGIMVFAVVNAIKKNKIEGMY